MRLLSFRVQGFKNLLEPVELTDLGDVNVLHGDNNVGKSNVLQALWVFFRLCKEAANRPQGANFSVNSGLTRPFGRPLASIFHVVHFTTPIELTGRLGLTAEDWRAVGRPAARVEPTDIEVGFRLQLERPDQANVQVCSIRIREPAGAAWAVATGGEVAGLAAFAWKELPAPAPRFAWVHADRSRLVSVTVEPPPARKAGDLLPADILKALFSAKEAPGAQQAAVWKRYQAAASHFASLLDGGKVLVLQPPGQDIQLYVEKGDEYRLPADQLGTGVQQLFALLGHLLTAEADIVAVEEPELNLRYDLQLRLREVLRDHVVGRPGGPSQLFFTSHSPAFEFGDTFYGMRRGEDGHPVVERKPRRELPVYLSQPGPVAVPRGAGALSWVSSDGLVQLPEFVRDALGVRQGGVVFHRVADGEVRILSDEQAAARLDASIEGREP